MQTIDQCLNCFITADELYTDTLEMSNNVIQNLKIYYSGDISTDIFQLMTENQIHTVLVTVDGTNTITQIELS